MTLAEAELQWLNEMLSATAANELLLLGMGGPLTPVDMTWHKVRRHKACVTGREGSGGGKEFHVTQRSRPQLSTGEGHGANLLAHHHLPSHSAPPLPHPTAPNIFTTAVLPTPGLNPKTSCPLNPNPAALTSLGLAQGRQAAGVGRAGGTDAVEQEQHGTGRRGGAYPLRYSGRV